MADTRTPRVELRINVQQGREKPREPQVLKSTKRHLVCEYDGLVFKQPREEEPAARTENIPMNRGASPHAAPVGNQPEQACQRGSSGTPSQSAAEATPAQKRGLPDSLEALCGGWFEAEARECGSEEVAAALRDICQRLCTGAGLGGAPSEAQLQRGAGMATTPAAAATAMNEEVEQADYQVDLEARKAGLRARLAGYEKEIADWEELVREAEQYSSEPVDAVEVATPESDAAEPAEIAELKKMHVDLHRHLTMQAEGLCKLVGDVEELVERANRTAHSLQADYHQEKFRAFPHVDSPARLIKEMVKPPAKRVQQQQQQPQ